MGDRPSIPFMPSPNMTSAPTRHPGALAWVQEIARRCRPDHIHWCDGSESERTQLLHECLEDGELERLDQQKWPGCFHHRSDPNDVARTEELTFICTPDKAGAGPTNNWMKP